MFHRYMYIYLYKGYQELALSDHTSHPFLCQINSRSFVYIYLYLYLYLFIFIYFIIYWHISPSGWARAINVLAVSLEILYKQYLS